MGKLPDETLQNMERYKGILDKEGNKLGIQKKYELECARAYVFSEGYTISDIS